MKNTASRLLLISLLAGSTLFADDLHWAGTWSSVWAGFGTSPYTAFDSTKNKTLVIFCLDYNDEIAPPLDWKANIRELNQQNVDQYAQFGGNYGHGITTTPWAFTGDNGVNPDHSVDFSGPADALSYTRYLEAAWLFTNILAAKTHNDLNTMVVSQVAAWDLLVESANVVDLQNRIHASNNPGVLYTYNNYVYSTNNYATAPGTHSIGGLIFQDAVNEALKAAQAAVGQNWYGSGFAPAWDLVTGDPAWTTAYGKPVQEFLTPGVPEPASILLFGTILLSAVSAIRRKMRHTPSSIAR